MSSSCLRGFWKIHMTMSTSSDLLNYRLLYNINYGAILSCGSWDVGAVTLSAK